MRKKLPKHGEVRTRYPFSLKRRYIEEHLVWFECYKLIEVYNRDSRKWRTYSIHLDDRVGIVSNKEEVKTFGGPY